MDNPHCYFWHKMSKNFSHPPTLTFSLYTNRYSGGSYVPEKFHFSWQNFVYYVTSVCLGHPDEERKLIGGLCDRLMIAVSSKFRPRSHPVYPLQCLLVFLTMWIRSDTVKWAGISLNKHVHRTGKIHREFRARAWFDRWTDARKIWNRRSSCDSLIHFTFLAV